MQRSWRVLVPRLHTTYVRGVPTYRRAACTTTSAVNTARSGRGSGNNDGRARLVSARGAKEWDAGPSSGEDRDGAWERREAGAERASRTVRGKEETRGTVVYGPATPPPQERNEERELKRSRSVWSLGDSWPVSVAALDRRARGSLARAVLTASRCEHRRPHLRPHFRPNRTRAAVRASARGASDDRASQSVISRTSATSLEPVAGRCIVVRQDRPRTRRRVLDLREIGLNVSPDSPSVGCPCDCETRDDLSAESPDADHVVREEDFSPSSAPQLASFLGQMRERQGEARG